MGRSPRPAISWRVGLVALVFVWLLQAQGWLQLLCEPGSLGRELDVTPSVHSQLKKPLSLPRMAVQGLGEELDSLSVPLLFVIQDTYNPGGREDVLLVHGGWITRKILPAPPVWSCPGLGRILEGCAIPVSQPRQ